MSLEGYLVEYNGEIAKKSIQWGPPPSICKLLLRQHWKDWLLSLACMKHHHHILLLMCLVSQTEYATAENMWLFLVGINLVTCIQHIQVNIWNIKAWNYNATRISPKIVKYWQLTIMVCWSHDSLKFCINQSLFSLWFFFFSLSLAKCEMCNYKACRVSPQRNTTGNAGLTQLSSNIYSLFHTTQMNR